MMLKNKVFHAGIKIKQQEVRLKAVASQAPDSPVRNLVREVLIRGPIARSDLADRLGLSVASLTRLSKPLLETGFLRETEDPQAGTVGRPARPLEVSPDSNRFVGIKVTGDAASGVATNLRSDAFDAVELPLAGQEPADVVAAVSGIVKRLGGSGVFSGVGISIGGKVGAGGTVLRAPFLGWRDVPLADLVRAELDLPVAVENDVVALTVAEQWFGAGRGERNFAVLTVGAGVGYGLVINDSVIAPPDAGLGLVGHYPLNPSGQLCAEGHRGCASAILTVNAICGQVAAVTGDRLPYPEVLQLAAEGLPVARRVVDDAGEYLGTLLAAVANLTMVDLIVLSGEGAGLADVAAERVLAGLRRHRDPDAGAVRLRRQPEDFSQWARGAAAVIIQRSISGSLR